MLHKAQRPPDKIRLTCDEVAKGLYDAIKAADLVNAGFGILGNPPQWSHSKLQYAHMEVSPNATASRGPANAEATMQVCPCQLARWPSMRTVFAC